MIVRVAAYGSRHETVTLEKRFIWSKTDKNVLEDWR